jgi:hypothetical protein
MDPLPQTPGSRFHDSIQRTHERSSTRILLDDDGAFLTELIAFIATLSAAAHVECAGHLTTRKLFSPASSGSVPNWVPLVAVRYAEKAGHLVVNDACPEDRREYEKNDSDHE